MITTKTKQAMDVSRTSTPDPESLDAIFRAEEIISRMPPEDIECLREQMAADPQDGFAHMWCALVGLHQKRHADAVSQLQQAIRHGCNHWRVGWYLAKAASGSGNLHLVDQACGAVLSANPDFWFAREFPKHARGYYAQCNQDKFIEKFFRSQEPRNKIFVEVGAFDGVHYSNVRRLFEKYNWQGLCIEPVRKNFDRLADSYRNSSVTCIRAAVGNEEKAAEINVSTYPHLPQWGSDVASLASDEMQRWTDTYRAVWSKEKVELKRLTTLLDENGVEDFDLMSVDAEGLGLEVLQGLDFTRFRPQLIVIEYGDARQQILELLARQGYSVCLDNGQDLFMGIIDHRPSRRSSADEFKPTRNYTGSAKQPAYEEIQKDVQCNIHTYIGKPASQVERIVIVGGYLGHEIDDFIQQYPGAEIHVFEPSHRYFNPLFERFANYPRIKCHNLAVADKQGKAVFHEGTLHGIGSLLPLITQEAEGTWIPENAAPAEHYPVDLVSLDTFPPLAGKQIDLLWCDVQGAELKVLQGAESILKNCRALFLEVAMSKETYHGQCFLSGLQQFLDRRGFYMAGIGLCPSGNGTGNSLWLRSDVAANGQRRCATSLSESEKSAVAAKLNPHMLSIIPIDKAVSKEVLQPFDLLRPHRMDLMAKVIYARHRALGIDSSWAKQLYAEHIRVINGGREGDGSGKEGIESFVGSFNDILDSITAKGFDETLSLVPIDRNNVIIDGAHRVAACLMADRPVSCVRFDIEANRYGLDFFQRNAPHVDQGLGQAWCDSLALEYCRLNRRTYIATLFPAAVGMEDAVQTIFKACADIVYAKKVLLETYGPFNLVRQMYAGEPWLGNYQNKFAGAHGKAAPCFSNSGPVRVYLLESDRPEALKKAKEKIRELFKIDNHSIHINDHHEETVRLAQLFFNDNSIHFLNFARPAFFERFYQLFYYYRDWMLRHGINGEHFCVDGSAVMAAYGLREPQDLDFLHHGYDDVDRCLAEISSHNQDAHHHVSTIDDIIFNPRQHFYFEGVKFASLDIIRQMKARRGEAKDVQDVKQIDSICVQDPEAVVNTAARPAKIVGLIAARNEEHIIGQCLQALSMVTDAIVFLDDASEDNTVNVVESLADECRVEQVIKKTKWYRDEPGDRNTLLEAGRKAGGTHFVVLDADEMFTANSTEQNFLRKQILALAPGEKLSMVWIQLWRSVDQYRFDNSVWTDNYKVFAFCDDGVCRYESAFIHTSRHPHLLAGKQVTIPDYTHGVLHFQFVNWRNLLVKQAWYRCLERIRQPEKSARAINSLYAPSKDENDLAVKPAPTKWFAAYHFFDPSVFSIPDSWREGQVLNWFEEYSREPFEALDIWDVDWTANSTVANPSARAGKNVPNRPVEPVEKIQKARNLAEKGNGQHAIDLLEKLLESHPDHAVAHNDLGVLYFKADEKEKAHGHYQKAIDLRPRNVTYLKNLADFLYVELGQVQEAMQLYIKVLAIHPADIDTLLIMAHICVALERPVDAAEFYERILQNNPEHAEAANLLSILQEKTGGSSDNAQMQPTLTQQTLLGSRPPDGRYLVSAIVSIYNAERFIRGCLQDLESQTIANQLEIIVVNSGSEQNEEAIVKEFQQRYPNIQYIQTQERETVYAAWNRGVRVAQGKYITNANTDDRHRKDAYEIMVRILETLPEIALVYADAIITETENESFEHCTPVGIFRWMNWNRQDLIQKGCFMGPQPMWRADVHREYGTFDASFVTSGDYEFWLRISQTYEFMRIPVCLGLYLRSAGSIEHTNREQQKKENDRIYRTYTQALTEKKIIGRAKEAGVDGFDAGAIPKSRTGLPAAATDARVSIIVSAIGSQAQLKKCLRSIKKHTPGAYEVLIVDGLAAKANPKWLQQRVNNDSRYRVVQGKKNAGPAVLFNIGIEAASGECIVLLSSDVIVFENWLSDLLACQSQVPGVGIVGPVANRAAGIQQAGLEKDRRSGTQDEVARAFRARNRHRWIRWDRLEGFCMLFHRRLKEEIGLLDEALCESETADLDWCIRAAVAGYTNAVAGDVYVHRTGKHSGSRNMKRLNRKWPVTDTQSAVGKRYLTHLAMDRGQRAFEKGDAARGTTLFLEGIKLSPNSRAVYHRFAECLINVKRFKDALEVLAELAPESEDLRAIELEAYGHEGLENDEEAMRLAERALALEPDSAAALNVKGMLAHRQGATEKAQACYRKAIQLAPGFGDPYTNLGALKWETDPDKSLKLLEKACILSPLSDDITNNYHTAIASVDGYPRAEAVYKEAVSANPDNKNIRFKYIDALLKQEKFEAAMVSIESAIARFGIDDGLLDAALAVRDRLEANKTSATRRKKDTISLCMIVKNEQKDIGRCLHSIKPAVDEMIVVDTGSDDRTCDIARVFGAKVYEIKWADDFAAARNFAIEQASGAWTFHLDADEVISRLDHNALRKLVRKSNSAPRAFIFNTRNYTLDVNQVGWEANDGRYPDEEAGSGWTPSEKVRLFPRDSRIRFEYPVHELVEPSLKRCGITMKNCPIPIHHYGKLNQPRSLEKKEAYYAIGTKKLAEMGDDPVALRELAIQAEILGRYDEALDLWERFVAIVPDNPQAYINMGIVHCRTGEFDALLATAQKALALNPELKEAHYNFALAKLHLNGAGEAAVALEELLSRVGEYPPAQFLLAAAYCLTQRKSESIDVLKQLQHSPIGPDLALRCWELARGLADAGNTGFALAMLEAAIESGIQSKEIMDLFSTCKQAEQAGRSSGGADSKPSDGASGHISGGSAKANRQTGSRAWI